MDIKTDLMLYPLITLIFIASLGLLGLGTVGTPDSSATIGGDTATTLYYDGGIPEGHPVCYANLTAYGEPGTVIESGGLCMWRNVSRPYGGYWMTWTNDGTASYIHWEDLGQTSSGGVSSAGVSIGSSLGLFALVAAIMILAGVAGLRVFGIGISESSVSTILSLTFYSMLWAIFSALAYPLLILDATFGAIFYFALTTAYTIGIVWTLKPT